MAEVFGHVAMAAAELEDRAVRILDRSQPQGGQVQRGRPALGPVPQNLDLLVVQLEPGAIDQELAGFPTVNASSRARTSLRAPRARSRASSSAGSARVIAIRRAVGGSCSIA